MALSLVSSLGRIVVGPGRWSRWETCALLIWATLLTALCVRGLITERSVYPVFERAARHWLAGEDLYREVKAHYRYSPLATTLFVPFSIFSDRLGSFLWRMLNAGVYLGALGWWSRSCLPASLTKERRAILFLLVIPLSLGSLGNGQSNALIVGLLLAGMACVSEQRWNAASAAIALACLFKIYPIALGGLVAVIHPRRFVGRFVLALAYGLTLPFLLQRPHYVVEQYAGWVRELTAEDRQSQSPEFWYRDLRLLCHSSHVPLSKAAYLEIQILAGAAFAMLCVWEARRGQEKHQLLTTVLGLACCWMTLFGIAAESSTYILMAPSLAWGVFAAWSNPQPKWQRWFWLASYALFTGAAMAVWFPGGRAFHTLGPHPLAVLIMLVALLATELAWLIPRPRTLDPLFGQTFGSPEVS